MCDILKNNEELCVYTYYFLMPVVCYVLNVTLRRNAYCKMLYYT